MSTKTIRLPPRGVSNSMPANNKRKQRDDFDPKHLTPPPVKSPKLASSDEAVDSGLSKLLLAGYLAHEFLTRGTLLGQTWDPDRSQLIRASESRKGIKEAEPGERSEASDAKSKEEKHKRYVVVANLLKEEGAHIPYIVNPSQLACFLQM